MTASRIALAVILFLLLVVAVSVGTILYRGYAYTAQLIRIEDRIDSLLTQRPTTINSENWEEAVGWARTAFMNLPIGSYEDPAPYRRFERDLEERIAAGDGLATLRWIWDDLVENSAHGTMYAAAYMPVRAMAEEPITDESLATFWGRDRVFELNLSDTQVGDDGLRHLKGCAMLEALVLDNTEVTGPGLAHLTDLAKLKYVGLEGCPITDEGIATIGDLTSLERLNLSETRITDAALAHLKSLPGLKKLYLNGTSVTPAAVEELQRALPDCEVHWESE
jgi:hypothetical protein